MFQSIDVSSENMRALPHDFARSFSNKELSRKMKVRARWGSSWEVGISKNPRFYFMEKSGWEKFVRDNALGHNEFITFTHKGKMRFTVNIFKQDGKEMMQPPQSRAFLASSSRIKTEQGEDGKKEEVVVSSELSNRGPTTAADTIGGGTNKRKLRNLKIPRGLRKWLVCGEILLVFIFVAEFTIIIGKTYLIFLRIPNSVAKYHMPKEKTMFKIHHSNGRKTWNVVYSVGEGQSIFNGGWGYLVKEYPIAVDDICKFTFIKPDELLLVVLKR